MKSHAPILTSALAVAFLFATMLALPAQELVMKDGRKIPAPGASRRGDKIYVTVRMGTGYGQIAYDANLIKTVKLPDLPDVVISERLMADDKAGEAIPHLDKVIRATEAFRGLADDRWGQAQLLKSSALAMIGKQADAEAVLQSIAAHDAGTPAARVAELRLDSFAPWNAGKADQWLQRAESFSAPENPAAVRAAAYVLKGHVLLQREKYEDALVAALHVPIFFAAERFDSARAQLIAGEAYLDIGDKKHAVRTFYDIERSFPNTAAAAAAQKEISKGGEPFAMIVEGLKKKELEDQNKFKANQQQSATTPPATPTPTPKP
ncbi:MAG: tetratricopeptide repeat protein [Chthoniobacterales bacterium]